MAEHFIVTATFYEFNISTSDTNSFPLLSYILIFNYLNVSTANFSSMFLFSLDINTSIVCVNRL